MNTVILAIGTLFSVFFAVMLFKGSSSDYMIEPLDDDAFPL